MSEISILVVEDDPTHRRLLKAFSESAGVSCTIVSTANEALNCLLKADQFDMVLMDCGMAEVSGLDCARKVRELELGTGKRIPIVAITAYTRADIEEDCLAAGMDDILPKPFCAADFGAMIKKHNRAQKSD